mmetsp:Transcript_44108/g.76893  ORF Transcript_44108/g.76893 Transcript_44108/m.76893 type:complete len:209 (+) Transcript_44108:4640-5266(+)
MYLSLVCYMLATDGRLCLVKISVTSLPLCCMILCSSPRPPHCLWTCTMETTRLTATVSRSRTHSPERRHRTTSRKWLALISAHTPSMVLCLVTLTTYRYPPSTRTEMVALLRLVVITPHRPNRCPSLLQMSAWTCILALRLLLTSLSARLCRTAAATSLATVLSWTSLPSSPTRSSILFLAMPEVLTLFSRLRPKATPMIPLLEVPSV